MNKSNVISKETQRAHEKMAHRDSFVARNYWLWIMIAWVFYPLSSLFSAMTEGGHVLLRMKTTMGDGFAPIAVTGILILIIEGLKYLLGKGAIDDIQAGVFSESGAHQAAFAVKVLGFIGVMAFSITLSIQGAPEFSAYLRENFQPVEATYVDKDAINTKYEQELLPHRENIRTYEQTTWKGKIVSEARRMILAEQQLIQGIEDRRSAELLRADEENDRTRADYEAKTAENGQWAMGFAGLGEVVCLFCLIFIGIYDDGLAREVEGQAPPPQQHQPPGFRYNQGPYRQIPANQTHYPSNRRRPIGFRYGDRPDVDPPSSTGSDPAVATGSYPSATAPEEKSRTEYQAEIKTLVGAYKKARSEYQAWAAKLDQGRGKPETNQRHMNELQARMDKLAGELSIYGIEVETLINKRS